MKTSKQNHSRGRRSSSLRGKQGLSFESLEPRCLLAGISFDSLTGIVTIDGSARSDSVRIIANSKTELTVRFDGFQAQTFRVAQVSEILFYARTGDDWFKNETNIASSAFGDGGNDFFVGGSGVDVFRGGTGLDRLVGNFGNDVLDGGADEDVLLGENDDDRLVGGDGNDSLNGGAGDDLIIAGDGDDDVRGSDGRDQIFGNAGADNLLGGNGIDLIAGQDGNDVMYGDGGDDELHGGMGDDQIWDGSGDDQIHGDEGADVLVGGFDDDEVYGGSGDDSIRGGDGADRLFGQDGRDFIHGDNGNDVVEGGGDSDILIGGAGDDDIYGDKEDEIHGDSNDSGGTSDPSTFARPIGLSNRLTVSFVPDGTSIFGESSQLFSAFTNMFDMDQIQGVILDGFNTWAQHGNLDVGFVPDSGDDFGTAGSSYGDTRFGDVRVGAMPMASDVFAIAMGQGEFVTGTWAGDILFNSNTRYKDAEQFMAVALHEIGHALGMEHTNDLTSVMHRYSVRTDLAPVDITKFQELYGSRSLDSYDDDEVVNNNSLDHATEIRFGDDHQIPGSFPSIIFGDVSDSADADYFKVETPDDYDGPITFQFVSEGISQLSPSVSLFDRLGNLITRVDSIRSHGDLISVSASSQDSEGKYYVKVDGGLGASTGSYSLITTLNGRNTIDSVQALNVATGRDFLQLDQEDIGEYFTDPGNYLFNDDDHGDDGIGSATELETEDGYGLGSRYLHRASLLDDQDVDTYKIKSLNFDSGTSYSMNVSVRAIDLGGMIPKAKILDEDGQELRSQIAVNGRGEFVLQIEQIGADAEYFIAVESDDLLPFNSGNYELTISYSVRPIVFNTYASGTINSGTSQYHSLHVAESQMIQFAFEADLLPGNPAATIWATIYDQTGAIVYQSLTRSGERRTAKTAFFKPGSYTIEIEGAFGSGFAGLDYRLIGIDVGGPQGPRFIDPSEFPFEKNKDGQYVYPDNVVSESTFVVVNGISPNQGNPPPHVPPANIYGWYWGLNL